MRENRYRTSATRRAAGRGTRGGRPSALGNPISRRPHPPGSMLVLCDPPRSPIKPDKRSDQQWRDAPRAAVEARWAALGHRQDQPRRGPTKPCRLFKEFATLMSPVLFPDLPTRMMPLFRHACSVISVLLGNVGPCVDPSAAGAQRSAYRRLNVRFRDFHPRTDGPVS